jgi:hypothetical protein
MTRFSAKIEIGDLVQLRSQHKLQRFYNIWNEVGIVTDIYESTKGKNKGEMIATIYFATKKQPYSTDREPYNKILKLLLKRMKKVR